MTIQPHQSHSNVCVIVTDDDIKEAPENFYLVISIPGSVQKLGVRVGSPYYADVLIIGIYVTTIAL